MTLRSAPIALAGFLCGVAPAADILVPGEQPTIQAGIDAANHGDVVIVAQGEYFETINFNDKPITVRSTDPTDPVVVMNTIINGTGFLHVVQCVNGEGPNSVLSGFVITGGNANGMSIYGGGMLNVASSPTVTYCSFIQNDASDYGGGMANTGANCNPTVSHCTFSSNSAIFGGGMHNASTSSPVVTDCTFIANSATYGGGMNNASASAPTVTDCFFGGNTANLGGGMNNSNTSSAVVTDCSFCGNSAASGGGMYNNSLVPTIQGCRFTSNTATDNGGGMNNNSTCTIENCTFSANSCGVNGGGVYNANGNSTFDGCSFIGNSAALGPIPAPAGGLHIAGGTPVLTNSGFCGNIAATIVGTWTDNGGNSLLYCGPPIVIPDPCPADSNDDGIVGIFDFLKVLADWGACP